MKEAAILGTVYNQQLKRSRDENVFAVKDKDLINLTKTFC